MASRSVRAHRPGPTAGAWPGLALSQSSGREASICRRCPSLATGCARTPRPPLCGSTATEAPATFPHSLPHEQLAVRQTNIGTIRQLTAAGGALPRSGPNLTSCLATRGLRKKLRPPLGQRLVATRMPTRSARRLRQAAAGAGYNAVLGGRRFLALASAVPLA